MNFSRQAKCVERIQKVVSRFIERIFKCFIKTDYLYTTPPFEIDDMLEEEYLPTVDIYLGNFTNLFFFSRS